MSNGAVLGEGSYAANADPSEAQTYIADARELQRESAATKVAVESLLRQKWGDADYEQARQLLEGREVDWTDADGVQREAVELAGGPLPTNADKIEEEIAIYEGLMRADRSAWMKNNRAQLRYRGLLKLKENK